MPPAGERAGTGPTFFVVAVAVAILFSGGLAHAQDKRPSEDEMFGGSGETKPPAAPAAPAPATPSAAPAAAVGGAEPKPNPPGEPPPAPVTVPPASAAATAAAAAAGPPSSSAGGRDDALLGSPDAGPQLSASVAPENPLTIGGQLYLRAQSTALAHTYPDRWTLVSPNLLDSYFDARPNDRVRAFIRGRISYDPTAPPIGTSSPTGNQMGASGGAQAGSSATGFSTFNASRGPNAVLDQIWIGSTSNTTSSSPPVNST